MVDLQNLLASLRSFKTTAPKVSSDFSGSPSSPLQTIARFGSNPGALRMLEYVPLQIAERRPLVVVLHGCGQTAAGYDHGAGWSTLADRYGFALLLPEQQRTNNPNGCFNWFQPCDAQRGQGEAASIRQMIEKMTLDHEIDPGRVFVTGLSAGGAMTSVMLACYPDVFAAGAIIAGLPFGTASNVQQALEAMYKCPSRSAQVWGNAVRHANPGYGGPWPRVSVWHGSADKTVVPRNAQEIINQWTSVHGLPLSPSIEESIDGHARLCWTDAEDREVIESYAIAHMAHGTPIATGDEPFQCGAEGPFLLETGISSSFHIARFFGLISDGAKTSVMRKALSPAVEQTSAMTTFATSTSHAENPGATSAAPKPDAQIDVGAIIVRALTVAGLMK